MSFRRNVLTCSFAVAVAATSAAPAQAASPPWVMTGEGSISPNNPGISPTTQSAAFKLTFTGIRSSGRVSASNCTMQWTGRDSSIGGAGSGSIYGCTGAQIKATFTYVRIGLAIQAKSSNFTINNTVYGTDFICLPFPYPNGTVVIVCTPYDVVYV